MRMYLDNKNKPKRPESDGCLDLFLLFNSTFGRHRYTKNKKNNKNAKNTYAANITSHQYILTIFLFLVFLFFLCFLLLKELCLPKAMWNTKNKWPSGLLLFALVFSVQLDYP